MRDTKINCVGLKCYWNTGQNEKDNCACGEVNVSYGRCQTFVTVEEAKRRLKIATAKFKKEKLFEVKNNG